MRPLKFPNIPEAAVELCALSAEAGKAAAALNRLGIRTIAVNRSNALPKPVACHADMLLNHTGGWDIFAAEPDAEYCAVLLQQGFNIIPLDIELGSSYPDDIALNIAAIGDAAFIGKRCPDSCAKKFYRNTHSCMSVNQGYARCSVCIVGLNAAVTADRTIYQAAEQIGLDVLLISPGGILLDGYDTGFIGGCCGLISHDTLAFCGDISLLPDSENIRAFLRSHGVYIEQLYGGIPEDIGGILPLLQM